jgi:hypothetical protein
MKGSWDMTDSTPAERRPPRRNEDEPEVEGHLMPEPDDSIEAERRPPRMNEDAGTDAEERRPPR